MCAKVPVRQRIGAREVARLLQQGQDALIVLVSSTRSTQNNMCLVHAQFKITTEKKEMNCNSEFVMFRKRPRQRDVARHKGISTVIDVQEDGSALYIVIEHLLVLC